MAARKRSIWSWLAWVVLFALSMAVAARQERELRRVAALAAPIEAREGAVFAKDSDLHDIEEQAWRIRALRDASLAVAAVVLLVPLLLWLSVAVQSRNAEKP